MSRIAKRGDASLVNLNYKLNTMSNINISNAVNVINNLIYKAEISLKVAQVLLKADDPVVAEFRELARRYKGGNHYTAQGGYCSISSKDHTAVVHIKKSSLVPSLVLVEAECTPDDWDGTFE
jgi:hypothetical protein